MNFTQFFKHNIKGYLSFINYNNIYQYYLIKWNNYSNIKQLALCHVPLLSVRQISFLICELEVYIEFYYHPLLQLLQMQSYQAISQQIMLLYVSIVKTLFSHIYYIHSFKYYMLGYLPSCYNFSCPFMVMQGYISRRKLHCISNKLCQLVQIQNRVKPLTF